MLNDLARLARELLSLTTTGRSGPESLLTRLTDLFFYGDFEIFEQVASVSDADQTNLVGYKYGRTTKGGLLLSAPLGVGAEADGEGRGHVDERRVSLRDGRICGRGATGGRLALLAQVAAAASIPRSELLRPVMVAGTFGDEHRGSGTQFLLESGHVMPEWVVVGAPTNLEIVRGHRGYMVFVVEIGAESEPWRRGFVARSSSHVVVPGVPSSSVLPGAGRSAFDRALALLDALPPDTPVSVHNLYAGRSLNRIPARCEFDLLSGAPASPGTFPKDVTIEPLPEETALSVPVTSCLRLWRTLAARIRAALGARRLPDAQEFSPSHALASVGRVETSRQGIAVTFDYRLLPAEDPYAVFKLVRGVVAEVAAEAGDHAIDVRVTINRPAMDLPRESPLVDALAGALRTHGLVPVASTLPHYTDGAMYASCDLDVAVFGPGWWGDAAAFGAESVPFQHLELATRVYQDLIRRLCC